MNGTDAGSDRAWDILVRSPYVLLTTFRKDGRAVATPVWAAPSQDGRFLVWTAPDAGKVKRIRRSGRVTLQPCSMRGEPVGRAIEARARVLGGEGDVRATYRALVRKYRLVGWVTLLPSRLLHRPAGVIELLPAE